MLARCHLTHAQDQIRLSRAVSFILQVSVELAKAGLAAVAPYTTRAGSAVWRQMENISGR